MPHVATALDQQTCEKLFMNCLLEGLSLQEHAAIQAIFKFIKEFVSMGYENSPLEKFVKEILRVVGSSIIKQLLFGLGGGQPSSLVPKVGNVLLQLFIFFPTATREGLTQWLSQEGFPTSNVTLQEKELFVKTLSGTRKPKMFNEAVRVFSSKCRGLG
jgi:hypothetical protein